jgi:hypothetical protein
MSAEGETVRAAVKRRRITDGVKVVNRVVHAIMSKPPVTAREHDVGADRDPVDEHAKERKDRQYERHYSRNVHSTHLPALRRDAKNRAGVKGESASRGLSHPKKRSKARTERNNRHFGTGTKRTCLPAPRISAEVG